MANGHGGSRPSSGRKSKVDELQLVEKLDNVINSDDVINILKGLISKNNIKALELYMAYRFGKPNQNLNVEIPEGALNFIIPGEDD